MPDQDARSSASRSKGLTGVLDVLIVGGGPAGAACGLALARRGLRVALFERSRYEDYRFGETLPPQIRPWLDRLGTWERFVAAGHRPSFGIKSAWGSPTLDETAFITNPHGHGWHLDRGRFDAMLVDAAADAGVAVARGCHVVTVARVPRGFRVHARCGGERVAVEARRLVDATGRAAVVARSLGERWLSTDTMVALIAETSAPTSAEGAAPGAFLLLEAASEGWWYSALLPSGALRVTYLTDVALMRAHARNAATFWEQRLRETIHTAARIARCPRRLTVRVCKAVSGRLSAAAGPGWVAAGDAASAYDPLSATGITRALTSGTDAAEVIARDLEGDGEALQRYAGRIDRTFTEYLRLRQSSYRREQRWPSSPFWRSRHAGERSLP